MRPLTVGEVMTRELVTVRPGDSLATVRDKMNDSRIRHVPVVGGDGQLAGLVSHRDLLRSTLIERAGVSSYVEDSILEDLQAKDVMNRELEVAKPETDLRDAARLMLREKYGCLPVVHERRLAGILTEADFIKVVLYED